MTEISIENQRHVLWSMCHACFRQQSLGSFVSAFSSLPFIFTFKMTHFESNFITVLFKLVKCLQLVKNNRNNGLSHCDLFSSNMDSQKRDYVSSGTTPNKPAAKRTRDVRRNVRKPIRISTGLLTPANSSSIAKFSTVTGTRALQRSSICSIKLTCISLHTSETQVNPFNVTLKFSFETQWT